MFSRQAASTAATPISAARAGLGCRISDLQCNRKAADGADFRTFTIRDVLHGSPASEAGLKVGDVIAAIGGVHAQEMSLEDLMARFRLEDRSYILTVKRADRAFEVRLRTRRIM
jgi:C-terminal processing protease CtpA/Prc